MIDGGSTKIRDWEWREVEYARRRERTKKLARRRGRLRLAGLILLLIAVAVSALLAARAVALPSPYARASLAIVGEKTRGAVAVLASKDDNEDVSDARGVPSVVTWEDGSSTVSSTVSDGALFSTSTVAITHVDLLDGLITADAVDLVASAAATKIATSGGVDVSRVAGLKVHGLDVPLDNLPLTIPGVGVLTALERREAEEDTALEAEVTGLHLHLTADWKQLPEGTDIVIGSAAACADEETAAQLLLRSPRGSADGGAEGASSSGGASGQDGSSGGGSGDASDGAGGGGSGGDGSGGGAWSGDDSPDKMSRPKASHDKLLPFPDAVFPVSGPVWYQDDFGAPRAVGGGHTGNDIFARRGTPVVAVQAGTINELRYRSLGGNSFHLANDAGDYFYYAHLLRYAAGIQEGSYVEAGQVLGYVGNTGNAITTPPHLHFEIHPGGGAPIDPFPYLELWRAGDTSAGADSGDAGGLPASSPSPGSLVNSLDAERGRHEEGVLLPHLPAPSTKAGMSAIALIPAAISFGALGGLMTTAARRHRDFLLVSMDAQDLCRAARAG